VSCNNFWGTAERKNFFFEKKKQKTFTHFGKDIIRTCSKMDRSFLVLFYKKELLAVVSQPFILTQALFGKKLMRLRRGPPPPQRGGGGLRVG
jgi:hypothetical protein